MDRSLRGKECGKGICRRKDGLYPARFVTKAGKRHVTSEPLDQAVRLFESNRVSDRKVHAEMA